MLSLNQVSVVRDQQIFNYHIDLNVGEALLVTGPSGKGKSTMLDAIAGYAEISTGQLLWQNTDIGAVAADHRPVSYLFQDHNLFDHLSIMQNYRAALPLVSEDQIIEAAKALNIEDQLAKCPPELSGGQRQRAGIIAAALRPEPILLMDEPFRELDPTTRASTIDWCMKQVVRLGKTLILVSHNHEDGDQVSAMFPSMTEYKIS